MVSNVENNGKIVEREQTEIGKYRLLSSEVLLKCGHEMVLHLVLQFVTVYARLMLHVLQVE